MSNSLSATAVSIENLCINTVRALSMDAVQAANSGHPGTPMALAPLCYVLWTRHLRHDPAHPDWIDRDRFILSCGHASMLLYSVLYLTGYDLDLEDIKNFRQLDSRTPGHPEYGATPGVETTTGPLGQGVGNAVGMAMAEAHLAAQFNRPDHELIRHWTYFLASDGDLMEGISHEAASLVGHLGLGRLIGFYDDNKITIDGETDLAFSDDTGARFVAYGWHVQRVEDGNDLAAIDAAIIEAKSVTDRPSLIIVRTHIGYGSPNKQDTAAAHGAPLGDAEVRLTKERLGWPVLDEAFHVPEEALAHWRQSQVRGAELFRAWTALEAAYQKRHANEYRELRRRLRGELPDGWDADLPTFSPADGPIATRSASGKVLNALAARVPELIGGSADLAGSVKTEIAGAVPFSKADVTGRSLFFGVREHAMGSVMNGLALHGGVRPFGGTFLIFSDYMRPAIRLAAMMEQNPIYLFSHDSIGLGEDGPTHQPVETLTALRVIPGLITLRPADAWDTVAAWRTAIEHDGPVALVLTRQNVPVFDRSTNGHEMDVSKGAYVLADSEDPQVILLASGSEVEIAMQARDILAGSNVRSRVVNMVSMELFAQQSADYQNRVLPKHVRARVAVEAAHPMSWYRWIGQDGASVTIDRFGMSAPYKQAYEALGITATNVANAASDLLR